MNVLRSALLGLVSLLIAGCGAARASPDAGVDASTPLPDAGTPEAGPE